MMINACNPVALATAQVSEDVRYLGTFEAAITGVIKFYHDNKEKGCGEGLQDIQQVLHELELKRSNEFWYVYKHYLQVFFPAHICIHTVLKFLSQAFKFHNIFKNYKI